MKKKISKKYRKARAAQTPLARLMDMALGWYYYANDIQGWHSPESCQLFELYQSAGSVSYPETTPPTEEQIRAFLIDNVLPFIVNGPNAEAIKEAKEWEADAKRSKKKTANKSKSEGKSNKR